MWTAHKLLNTKSQQIIHSREVEITNCEFAPYCDDDVPEAQDTADGVGDVILGSIVVRDEDGAEILEDISSVIWW